jgi:hypothetical protein
MGAESESGTSSRTPNFLRCAIVGNFEVGVCFVFEDLMWGRFAGVRERWALKVKAELHSALQILQS